MAYEERNDRKTEEETIKLMDKIKNEGWFDGKIYKERKQYYLDLSDFIIDTDNENILNIAMKINSLLLDNEIIN